MLASFWQFQVSLKIKDITMTVKNYCELIMTGYVPTACLTNKKSTAAQPAPQLVEVYVNDKQVFVEPGTTVLQVDFTNLLLC